MLFDLVTLKRTTRYPQILLAGKGILRTTCNQHSLQLHQGECNTGIPSHRAALRTNCLVSCRRITIRTCLVSGLLFTFSVPRPASCSDSSKVSSATPSSASHPPLAGVPLFFAEDKQLRILNLSFILSAVRRPEVSICSAHLDESLFCLLPCFGINFGQIDSLPTALLLEART